MIPRCLIAAAMAAAAPAFAATLSNPLISLEFSGTMGEIERQTFIDAAAFWNSVIVGYDVINDAVGGQTPHGLVISASVTPFDGVGNVLASAGWDTASYYDNDPFTPNPTVALYFASTGSMEFDSADVAALVGNNTFYGVVLHEMAHVLGIGTLWTLNNNVNGTSYQLYNSGSGQYTGPNALREWRSEFNQPAATFVPVELGGNPGTADGHWDEVDYAFGLTGFTSATTGLDFANELMTGWASNPFFLSRTTLGALDDLGYEVDYSKAGVIDHVVVVPEASALLLAAAAATLLVRRRRA